MCIYQCNCHHLCTFTHPHSYTCIIQILFQLYPCQLYGIWAGWMLIMHESRNWTSKGHYQVKMPLQRSSYFRFLEKEVWNCSIHVWSNTLTGLFYCLCLKLPHSRSYYYTLQTLNRGIWHVLFTVRPSVLETLATVTFQSCIWGHTFVFYSAQWQMTFFRRGRWLLVKEFRLFLL